MPSAVRYRCQRYRCLFSPELSPRVLLPPRSLERGVHDVRVFLSFCGSSYLHPTYLSRAMPEGMLQLTVSLFIFSRELLCLHKLPGTSNRRVSTSTSSFATSLRARRTLPRSSIYLVFSRREFVDPVGEMLNCRKCPRRCTDLGNLVS